MKKHSGLPLLLPLIILLIAQQVLTLHAPAENRAVAGPVARSAEAYQRQEEDVLVPIDLKAFEEDPDFGFGPFSVVEVDMTALGSLKDCREDVPQIGASVKLTTNVIDAGTGPAPDYKREFGFDFDSDDKRFKVMQAASPNGSSSDSPIRSGCGSQPMNEMSVAGL